jgi:hypothetical protein
MKSTALLITLLLINVVFYFTMLVRNLFRNTIGPYIKVYRLEITFLGISLIQYIMNLIIENSPYSDTYGSLIMVQFRFVCSLLTSPLVLYSYYQIATDDGYKGSFSILLVAVLVMIFAGVIREYASHVVWLKQLTYLIIAACFGLIVWRLSLIMKYFKNFHSNAGDARYRLGYFLIFGWVLYLGSMFISRDNELKFIVYALGDFITRALYSLALNTALVKPII